MLLEKEFSSYKMDFRVRGSRSNSTTNYAAVWSWASYLTFQNLGFLKHKVKNIVVMIKYDEVREVLSRVTGIQEALDTW